MRVLWKEFRPDFHQPRSRFETLVTIHIARTQTEVIDPNLRYYSHRWLLDHEYPTFLPDELKPLAERIYPRIAEGVGIAVKSADSERASLIRSAMSDAVMEAYEDKNTDPKFVKSRMFDARKKILKQF